MTMLEPTKAPVSATRIPSESIQVRCQSRVGKWFAANAVPW